MKRDPIITQALQLLALEVREADALVSPDSVRDYLRLLLAGRPHEVFVVVFLDSQNRVIATEEMFRGTLTQTSVYHRHPGGRQLRHRRRPRRQQGHAGDHHRDLR